MEHARRCIMCTVTPLQPQHPVPPEIGEQAVMQPAAAPHCHGIQDRQVRGAHHGPTAGAGHVAEPPLPALAGTLLPPLPAALYGSATRMPARAAAACQPNKYYYSCTVCTSRTRCLQHHIHYLPPGIGVAAPANAAAAASFNMPGCPARPSLFDQAAAAAKAQSVLCRISLKLKHIRSAADPR